MSFRINTVTVDGNLTRDPELRSTNSGTSVCGLRIAHNARRKDSSGDWVDIPQYFDVTVWSGVGEWVAKNLSKGDKIVVTGELRWREWDDKDGNKRQSVDINATGIVTPNNSGGGGGGRSAEDEFGPPPGGDDDLPLDSSAGSSAADDDSIPF